ncbi:MAG: hypothetical protein IJY23_08560 [Clostridia bacterium]|nr:hypothetical protein [Clostridia bacterium]
MNEKIIPFSYRTLADKRRAMPTFFTLIGISALLVVLSMTVDKYAGIISLLAVAGLTASTMFYIRYITSDYSYSVREGSDSDAFLIFTKVVGKRQSMMGCLPLYSIISIQKFTKNELKLHKTEAGYRKYNFAASFSPDAVYMILAKTRTESFEVIIEGTDELAARLLEYAALAKADFKEESDEEEEN